MGKSLQRMFLDLRDQGHEPSIYLRGDLFRAHVDRGGNFWADHHSPVMAMKLACRLYEDRNKQLQE